MKFVVFATAPDEITALVWRDLVVQQGIPCELRAGDVAGYLGVMTKPVRLVTPEAFLVNAQAAVREMFDSDAVPDERPDSETVAP